MVVSKIDVQRDGASSKAYRVEQLEKQGVGIKNKIMRCSVLLYAFDSILECT